MKLIEKEKFGNIRKITLFNCIKFSYKKKNRHTTKNEINFSGDYNSWQEAVNVSKEGYAVANILQKTLQSTLKVKNGEAVFERDSYIFDKIQYSYPLLSCLFKTAVESNNELNVLDFGGALGSHYFQNKEFLKPVKIKSWTVVEQPHYTEAGNKQIADKILNFKNSIDEVQDANVLLLSSVLQYLPDPYNWIEKFVQKGIKYIIIDRTAFSSENRDRLTVETVPPYIYEAKYPAWFLDEKKVLEKFKTKYDLILDFTSTIDFVNEIPSYYKGFLFKRSDYNA